MGEALIRMENVSKFYGRIQALEGVNLTVYESFGPKEVSDTVEIFRKVGAAYRK